ncbi:hypothetical protein AMAG_19622 [Allomyces macrogynus ATCC 38327]|uniref:Secreted peptide n=1 Tax=Allomyces macrogynus (strain ATCC 38327) TaxID=578462 RepID=A0A0L0SXY2_ALLM3|nr:hypothetical protein AMAG_19622 [Allomyces macrogynus ATCC 38327]|eukprot:KNE67362.1 hypothetical protein AMAG_19622 [Allomyces macrogynus ATCC 38327]
MFLRLFLFVSFFLRPHPSRAHHEHARALFFLLLLLLLFRLALIDSFLERYVLWARCFSLSPSRRFSLPTLTTLLTFQPFASFWKPVLVIWIFIQPTTYASPSAASALIRAAFCRHEARNQAGNWSGNEDPTINQS